MILFLDLATRRTGWCYGLSGVPRCGTLRLCGGDDLGALLLALSNGLDDITVSGVTAIGYESPITIARDKLKSKRALYSLGGYVEYWAKVRGVPVFETSLQSLKTELTGKHNASKSDMVAMAKKAGIDLPKGADAEDAADAFAGWLIALGRHDRAMRARWDQRIYTGRGNLL